MQKAACPDVLVHSCILLKIFVVLHFKLHNSQFRKEILQSKSMPNDLQHQDRSDRAASADSALHSGCLMICLLFRGANIVIKRSSHSGCKLEFTEGLQKNIIHLKVRRTKPPRELHCFM